MALTSPPASPWTSPSSPGFSLQFLPIPVLDALAAGDLALASALAPPSAPPLVPFLVSPNTCAHLRRRLDQVAADPDQGPWLSRLIVYDAAQESEAQGSETRTAAVQPGPVIVGRISFHGKPDAQGMVELGYRIEEAYRGKGYAKAAMRIMLDVARGVEGVIVLRARLDKENVASRRVAEGAGLRWVASRMHESKGMVGVFELDVT